MRVECPNCGAKGEIDESKRPPGAVSIRCPRCRESIPLAPAPESAVSAVAPPAAAAVAEPPPPVAEAGAEAGSIPPGPEPVPLQQCSICNRPYPREDMVRFGPQLVCASCKPTFVQMLEQGASRPGSLRYAGFWIRFCAKIVDGLILMVVNFVISFMINLMIMSTAKPSAAIAAGLLSYFINMSIAVGMTTYFLGKFAATPGKMALGLMVVTPEGERISYLRAFGRYFAEILSWIILLIGYIMAAFDEEKRALHDRLCETRVVYK